MENLMVSPFNKITTKEVYEERQSQICFERIYKEMITRVKETSPYKHLMEEAVQNILSDHLGIEPCIDVQEKKRQIQVIGSFAAQYDSSISDILAETIENRIKPAVIKTINQLSTTTEGSSLSRKRIKRSPEMYSNFKICKNGEANFKRFRTVVTPESGSESDASVESVSSVHTSELSSFEDEIIVPTEDKSNGKKPKILSFKAVSQAYKSMMTAQNETSSGKSIQSTSKVQVSSSESSGSENTVPCKVLLRRKRKPNSKYLEDN